jgi:glycosyltransferase involved in cell wall biosynthesis
MPKKIIRTSTIPVSLNILLNGQLAFLLKYYEVIAISGEGEDLEEVFTREGVKIQAIEMQRSISPVKDLISLVKLFLYFRKERPLIVHSITPKAGLLTMVAGFFAGVPIRMHTFTGLIFPSRNGFMQKLLILMDKVLCYCATNIYPEGQGVRNDLIKYKITSKPLQIIANGNVNGVNSDFLCPDLFSDADKISLRKDLGIDPGDFVFIFVGRLVGDKGINELVEAFQKVSRIRERIKLVLVGSFEANLDPLQQKNLEEISINNSIISVGFKKDIRGYLAIGDCFTFPSYREGFPNVVLQAGAMGLPSIVTNINGCNEIIKEGENGIIIPVKDSGALYEAMKKMLEDTDFRIKLVKNSRSMIVSRYEQKVVWEAVLAEYNRLEKDV